MKTKLLRNKGTPRPEKPDEIQRAFWLYRRFWIAVFILLVIGRFVLPRIPLLKGWEQKFSNAAIEIAKLDVPADALRVSSISAVTPLLTKGRNPPPEFFEVTGPQLIAAWACRPLNQEGLCLRYLWDQKPVTLVMSFRPKKTHRLVGPFSRTGWGGYFIVHSDMAAILVGPMDPAEIVSAWPVARRPTLQSH